MYNNYKLIIIGRYVIVISVTYYTLIGIGR